MPKAGCPSTDCDLQEFMLYKKIWGRGRGERKVFLNIRKKSNTANYPELPIRLTDSHRGHTQWLFCISELYFNPSSFLFFHFQSVKDPNVFCQLIFNGIVSIQEALSNNHYTTAFRDPCGCFHLPCIPPHPLSPYISRGDLFLTGKASN